MHMSYEGHNPWHAVYLFTNEVPLFMLLTAKLLSGDILLLLPRFSLDQAWVMSCPRAAYGPPSTLMWSASYV